VGSVVSGQGGLSARWKTFLWRAMGLGLTLSLAACTPDGLSVQQLTPTSSSLLRQGKVLTPTNTATELTARPVVSSELRSHQTGAVEPSSQGTAAPAGTATEPLESASRSSIDDLVGREVRDLARQLRLGPGAITVLSVEAVDWPDVSMGCAQPGVAYAQQVTPGYVVRLEALGRRYEYHSGGGKSVLCQTATTETAETAAPGPTAARAPRAWQIAEIGIEVTVPMGSGWRSSLMGSWILAS
jgi:hypothetical protein